MLFTRLYARVHELDDDMGTDQQQDNMEQLTHDNSSETSEEKRSFLGAIYHVVHLVSWAIIFTTGLLASLLFALQIGLLDSTISNYAQSAFERLNQKSGRVNVNSTVLRLTMDGKIAVEGRGIYLDNSDEVEKVGAPYRDINIEMSVQKARFKLSAFDLLFNVPKINAIHIKGAEISLAPEITSSQTHSFPRVDQLRDLPQQFVSAINIISNQSITKDIKQFVLEDIIINHPRFKKNGALNITHADILLKDNVFNGFDAAARFGRDDINLAARRMPGEGEIFELLIENLMVDLESRDPNPDFRSGLKTELTARLLIAQAIDNNPAKLEMDIRLAPGTLKLGGEDADLGESQLFMAYDFKKDSIELTSSIVKIGQSSFPLTGGLIDWDRFEGAPKNSLVYDIIVDQGALAPTDTDLSPIIMSAKAFGFFQPEIGRIEARDLLITVDDEYVAGNMVMKFPGHTSPEINLAVKVPKMRTSTVKQLWPFWLGRGARSWAIENIFGGTITDVNFWLSIDEGRLANPARPIRHSDENYRVDYRFENARVNLAGNIPPLRGATGRIEVVGEKLTIHIDEGTSYFPSDRKIDLLQGSTLTFTNTNNVPLMADVDLNMRGTGDAAAELISFEPIDALDRLGISPEDISGRIEGNVKARFGLLISQNPPAPEWEAFLTLDDVDLSVPIEGRMLTEINGVLNVSSERAELAGEMKLDGIQVEAKMTEPFVGSKITASRALKGTLSSEDRTQLGLGLENILFGDAEFELRRLNDSQNMITLDVTPSRIIVPGSGWTKARNVSAQVEFVLTQKDEQYNIEDFRFFGDGFAASGKMSFDDRGIKSATFDRINLAPKDDYGLDANRDGNVLYVNLRGNSMDMRPLIDSLKGSESEVRRQIKGQLGYEIKGKLNSIAGFGGERLTNVDLSYSERNNIATRVKFAGRTEKNGSIAIESNGDVTGETINLVSDDAGSFWRFFDIYEYVEGGALDIAVRQDGNDPQIGQAIMRNFQVIGDERLKTLVSSRSNENEKSLNEALNGQLDVTRVTFSEALIDFQLEDGRLDISKGIVRGPQIGSSFKGMLYDADNRTDFSGTFMPAYSVNRIFGEIPVLGALLGNGNDRALLGITFRVRGDADDPRIQVNPLSAIAPGVFRNIFAFQ